MNPTSALPKKLPVGIWIRVSTDDQAQGDSPKHHEIRARTYAESKGWEVRELYDLAGVSGKSVKDHPEAKRMIEDVKRGHIKGLIFSKLARFARNTKELLDFAEYFEKKGAALISLQESIDTSTPVGRLFYTIIAAMAQWEREEIGDRVRVSIGVRAKLGKPISGSAPYGYHWVSKKLVQHPEEAPVRKRAYELFRQHRRKGVVAKMLNEAGHRTRTGKEWYDTSVGRVLTDSSAKGVYVHNRTTKTGNWKSEMKPESEWGFVPVEPIISEELWTEVNRLLEEQHSKFVRPAKRPKQLFAGIAICACGGKMYVPFSTPKYVCQKCRAKIPVVDLEDFFLEQVKDFFTNPARLAEKLNGAHEAVGEKAQLLEAQRREVQKVRDEMTRTHRLYLDSAVEPETFKALFGPLETRLKQLQSDIPKLEAELDLKRVNDLTAEVVKKEATDLYGRWQDMDSEEKRGILENIVQRITIDAEKKECTVTFFSPSTSLETTNSQQHL